MSYANSVTSGSTSAGAVGSAGIVVAEGTTVSASSLLPEPVLGLVLGDPGAALAGLSVLAGRAERDAAQTMRDAMEAGQELQEDKEVDAMRAKAATLLAQGLAEGIGDCAEGLLTIGSGAAALNGAANRPGTYLGVTEAGWKAGAAFAVAAGKITGAVYQAQGGNDDADAAAAHALAGHYANFIQDAHDHMQAASSFIQSAIDFYREYTATQAQIRNAATHLA
jgi:hypothetical protein